MHKIKKALMSKTKGLVAGGGGGGNKLGGAFKSALGAAKLGGGLKVGSSTNKPPMAGLGAQRKGRGAAMGKGFMGRGNK